MNKNENSLILFKGGQHIPAFFGIVEYITQTIK